MQCWQNATRQCSLVVWCSPANNLKASIDCRITENVKSMSAFEELIKKNRRVVNKARLNSCLVELPGNYKLPPPPEEEYVHATLEPFADISDELYDKIKEKKLFPLRIRTRPGSVKAYMKVVFRNGVEEAYDIKQAIKLLPVIVSGRAPIEWAKHSSFIPYGSNGPFMYKGQLIAFLDDELICLFTVEHFWTERRKFIRYYNRISKRVRIDRKEAFEQPYTEYLTSGWYAPGPPDLNLRNATLKELQQAFQEAREERRIDSKSKQGLLFDTQGLTKEERKKLLAQQDAFLLQQELDKRMLPDKFEARSNLLFESQMELCSAIIKKKDEEQFQRPPKWPNIVAKADDLDGLVTGVYHKEPTKFGLPQNTHLKTHNIKDALSDWDGISDQRRYGRMPPTLPFNDAVLSEQYWKNQKLPPTQQKLESLFRPIELNINRPIDFESGLNSTDNFVTTLLPTFVRRKQLKKRGLVKHAHFNKCLNDKDQAVFDAPIPESAMQTTKLPRKTSSPSNRRSHSALPSSNEPQNETVLQNQRNKRSKSAEPAVPLWWCQKKYLLNVSKRKKYEELQYVDIEAMGFTF